MALTKGKKKEIVESVGEKIKGAVSLVFLNFHGLSVGEANAIRRACRAKGLGYTVAKKTLLARALADARIAGELPALQGEVAIAYGPDALLPARELADFAKKLKEKIRILGGVLEGKYLSAQEAMALAKIPSREVLIAQLLGVMQGPVRGLVTALAGVPRNLVVVLQEIQKKK